MGGRVNDVANGGNRARAILLALEAGLPREKPKASCASSREIATGAEVRIVADDTKVVDRAGATDSSATRRALATWLRACRPGAMTARKRAEAWAILRALGPSGFVGRTLPSPSQPSAWAVQPVSRRVVAERRRARCVALSPSVERQVAAPEGDAKPISWSAVVTLLREVAHRGRPGAAWPGRGAQVRSAEVWRRPVALVSIQRMMMDVP